MDFQAKVYALMAGIAGTVAVLLFIIFMASSLLVNKIDHAYVEGKAFALLINDARQAQTALQRQVIEWKNVLLRGTDPNAKKTYIATFSQYEKQTNNKLKDLRAQVADLQMAAQVKQIDRLITDHKALGVRYREALETYPYLSYVGQQTLDRSVKDADLPAIEGMDKLVAELTELTETRFDAQSLAVHSSMTKRNLVFSVLALFLSVGLIYFLFNMVKQLLDVLGDSPERVVASTNRIAKGDLTEKLSATRPDSLLGALEMMQLRLRNVMLAVDSATQDFRINIKQIDKSYQRKALEDTLSELDGAMSRIKVHRD